MSIVISARAVLRVQQHFFVGVNENTLSYIYEEGPEEEVGNILTDRGRVSLHTMLYGSSAQKASLGTGFHFVGLTNNSALPAAGDTSLTAELVGLGLSRAAGQVILPTGAGTVTTIQRTFTYTGTVPQSVQKTALFDAATGGNMVHEIRFAPRLLSTNDMLSLSFAITLT